MSKHDYIIEYASGPVSAASYAAAPSHARLAKSRWYSAVGKPVFDVVFALLLMPVILPLIAILALFIALDGGSPFYLQPRVGKNGRVFRMWKLRTMVADAEDRLQAHLAGSPAARVEWDLKQKLQHDPRITPLGRFLRRTSLDELPQFFNVLAGQMSVVGPRPMMASQQTLYPGQSYYSLRPGVTGLWQVSDRNNASFADRAHFDDTYRQSLSLGTDLRVVAETVNVVLRGTGC